MTVIDCGRDATTGTLFQAPGRFHNLRSTLSDLPRLLLPAQRIAQRPAG